MKKQKGQAIVEFALILPIFMMLCFGAILGGLVFADYMTLSSVARSSVREAALGRDNDDIRSVYGPETKLITDMYTWDYNDESKFEIRRDTFGNLENAVRVTIIADLNESFPGVKFLRSAVAFPPEHIEIRYTMHDEVISENKSEDNGE